ncbi:peptidoglycan recognition protein family protein [Streptomyces lushanensis]|uniref:peptidoglycan recognition protein family protein n=1 Tax=Streptomyces lushanensis TaxID=1434255 RepID=UPI00082F0566|nr:peptidoglycan recognition protein [Streptomyces lushanensis]
MRAYLASSIGAVCTAALVLPLSPPTSALAAPRVAAPQDAGAAAAGAGTRASRAEGSPAVSAVRAVSGSTQSLALTALASDRASGARPEEGAAQGLTSRDVRPFSLLGVVWDDAEAELHGTVQVRTRARKTHGWSGWQALDTHNREHGADPGTTERDAAGVRGSTAPLWVGDSDGVEIRVRAAREPGTREHGGAGPGAEGAPREPLPHGLSLELVDPGKDPAGPAGRRATALPALSRARTGAGPTGAGRAEAGRAGPRAARPYIGPRPRIVTRGGWGADESLRERRFGYSRTLTAAFVHHSATGNNYGCRQSAAVLRAVYRYHVKSSGWRDIGYNFAVDKCGNIYEGRAGGVTKPVKGAHTLGLNANTMGIAVLGTYGGTNPSVAATTAVARLTAWKLGLHRVDPRGKVTLISSGNGKYKKGTKVGLRAISGHRDGFNTDCPGTRLYGKLGTTRATAARYQGR